MLMKLTHATKLLIAMSLQYRLEWFKLLLHSKSSFTIDFSLDFCEIHHCSINKDLSVVSDFSHEQDQFVGGDKLSPVFKHGFLRSEENVFPASFLHTNCVQENIFLYNFEYLCMVGSITIHVGRCYCNILPNTLCFVADVIASADVIAMFCVLFLLLRLMFLPHY